MNGESLIKCNRNQDYQNRNYGQVNLQKNNKKLSSQLKFLFPFIHGEKESILFAVAYNKQMSNFPVTFNVLNQNIIVNKAFLQYFTHHHSYFWCQIFLLICLFPPVFPCLHIKHSFCVLQFNPFPSPSHSSCCFPSSLWNACALKPSWLLSNIPHFAMWLAAMATSSHFLFFSCLLPQYPCQCNHLWQGAAKIYHELILLLSCSGAF